MNSGLIQHAHVPATYACTRAVSCIAANHARGVSDQCVRLATCGTMRRHVRATKWTCAQLRKSSLRRFRMGQLGVCLAGRVYRCADVAVLQIARAKPCYAWQSLHA